MVQQHFAKYLGKPIWNLRTEQRVTLTAVRKDCLLFLNGKPTEQQGDFNDFKILCASDGEVFENDIPIDLAVVEIETTVVRKTLKYTPVTFLAKVKKLVYEPRQLTDDIMWKNRRNRKRIYLVPRQVVMSAYFCAFENKGVSQSAAGAVYGLDHATLLNAVKACNDLLDTSYVFREEYKPVWELILQVNPKSRLHII